MSNKPKKRLKNLTAPDAAMPVRSKKINPKPKPRKIPRGVNIGWVA
jgi:hypothetical protein